MAWAASRNASAAEASACDAADWSADSAAAVSARCTGVIAGSWSPSRFRSSAVCFASPFGFAWELPLAVRDSDRLRAVSAEARCSFPGSSWE